MLSTTTVQYIKSETETYRAISVLYSRELDGCSLFKTILNSFRQSSLLTYKKTFKFVILNIWIFSTLNNSLW